MKQNPKKNKLTISDATLQKLTNISGMVGEAALVGLVALKLEDYLEKSKTSYTDILKLFQNDQISAYHLNLSSRELRYLLKGDLSPKAAIIPNTKLFLSDIHEAVKKHNQEHPEDTILMNYRHGIPTWIYGVSAIVIALLYFMNMFLASQAKGLQQIQIMTKEDPRKDFTKSTFTEETNRKATFADVAGAEEEKEELQEIVEYLKEPEKFTKLGARVPKGVLLEGPPGTGKTLLARAVAGEANVPFFSISGSEFVEMFVGVGAARVRDLFQAAKAKAPCIIFIDEIDAIARKRASDLLSGNEERETTLNQLLVEMDGFGSETGIIMIGATNRSDVLDPALLRPGRFDRHVTVGYPDINGRKAILEVHAKGKPLDAEVDLLDIAKNTAGFSGADLENLLNEAALLAAKRNRSTIGNQELKESAVKVQMGAEKRSKKMTEKERKLTAFHEAGHAVATYYLENLDPVEEVSIIPRGGAGGYTMFQPQEDKSYMSKNEMLEELVSLLGGRVAEALVMGDISTGASNDIERATALARGMITRFGMNEKLGPVAYDTSSNPYQNNSYSEETASEIDQEVKGQMKAAYAQCERILKDHRDQLDTLANYLLEHEKINAERFQKLMSGEPTTETSPAV